MTFERISILAIIMLLGDDEMNGEKRELRKLTMDDVQAGTDTLQLPVIFTGTSEECKAHAESLGCVWKDSPRMLFGGYWHKPATGKDDLGFCLNIT